MLCSVESKEEAAKVGNRCRGKRDEVEVKGTCTLGHSVIAVTPTL